MEDDWKICRFIRRVVNKTRLLLGYTLVNRHGYKVRMRGFKQEWSNPRRTKVYNCDDFSWRVYGWRTNL